MSVIENTDENNIAIKNNDEDMDDIDGFIIIEIIQTDLCLDQHFVFDFYLFI